METKTVRILLADDQETVRQHLRDMLAHMEGVEVAGEAANGLDVMRMVREGSWDLLILDITMPIMSGFDVLRELQVEKPDLPVLILSVHPAGQYEKRARQLGAAGYVVKDRAPEDLADAIHRILESAA